MDSKIVEATWAWPELTVNPLHEELVRELLAFDFLCPISSLFEFDDGTGNLIVKYQPSAMSWSRKFEWPWAVQKGDLQWDHTVLDAGSGHSVFKYALASRVKEVHSLDADDSRYEMIQRGRPFRMHPNIRLVKGDIRHLPYADNTFDSCFCISVLEHTAGAEEWCIAELLRVVKVGRPVLVTMDVAIENPTEEFPIDLQKAHNLIQCFGGVGLQNPREGQRAVCQVFDQTKLLCLCLKIVKGD